MLSIAKATTTVAAAKQICISDSKLPTSEWDKWNKNQRSRKHIGDNLFL